MQHEHMRISELTIITSTISASVLSLEEMYDKGTEADPKL